MAIRAYLSPSVAEGAPAARFAAEASCAFLGLVLVACGRGSSRCSPLLPRCAGTLFFDVKRISSSCEGRTARLSSPGSSQGPLRCQMVQVPSRLRVQARRQARASTAQFPQQRTSE